MPKINILQWNINGILNNINDLQVIIQERDPHIMCFQETHLKSGEDFPLKKFSHLKKPNSNALHASGGVAVYIKNNIRFTPLPLKTYIQAVVNLGKKREK